VEDIIAQGVQTDVRNAITLTLKATKSILQGKFKMKKDTKFDENKLNKIKKQVIVKKKGGLEQAKKEASEKQEKSFNAKYGEGKMKVNGVACNLNMPPAIKSVKMDNGEEMVQGLPGYGVRKSFVVDEYPACPVNWEHGSDLASSYFIPIKEDHGMWLDFNECCGHTHQVAAVVSVQGVNSVTGQKTEVIQLEQYKKNCPVHDKPFAQDRFCEDCGYKWPAQNYLSTTGTPNGQFWLDGFRTPDGKVRQYIFTEEEARGVAANVIGKDRVFAIGIAFYLSKEKKPQPANAQYSGRSIGIASGLYSTNLGNFAQGYKSKSVCDDNKSLHQFASGEANLDMFDIAKGGVVNDTQNTSIPSVESVNFVAPNNPAITTDALVENQEAYTETSFVDPNSFDPNPNTPIPKKKKGSPVRSRNVATVKIQKNLEVGAGASINQEILPDPQDIDFWQEEPVGMIYINYCSEEDAAKIIAAGKREETKEGFLSGIPTGN